MHAHLEIIVCKSGRNLAIWPREEVILVRSQKCPYHVTFDLDLEHTLDARSPGDHRVKVWSQSSHLSCGRSNLCKKLTDGWTDRKRTPNHCISSWNELKIGPYTYVSGKASFSVFWTTDTTTMGGAGLMIARSGFQSRWRSCSNRGSVALCTLGLGLLNPPSFQGW